MSPHRHENWISKPKDIASEYYFWVEMIIDIKFTFLAVLFMHGWCDDYSVKYDFFYKVGDNRLITRDTDVMLWLWLNVYCILLLLSCPSAKKIHELFFPFKILLVLHFSFNHHHYYIILIPLYFVHKRRSRQT